MPVYALAIRGSREKSRSEQNFYIGGILGSAELVNHVAAVQGTELHKQVTLVGHIDALEDGSCLRTPANAANTVKATIEPWCARKGVMSESGVTVVGVKIVVEVPAISARVRQAKLYPRWGDATKLPVEIPFTVIRPPTGLPGLLLESEDSVIRRVRSTDTGGDIAFYD